MVANPPANTEDVREAVLIRGQEDLLEDGMATQASILSWSILWTEEDWQTIVHRVTKSQT